MWQALELLHVSRVDHGNRSLDDEALVSHLARHRIPLTVCPLSNLRLAVVEEIGQHPLLEMLNRGLVVTVNSDDPAYFGGYVNANYEAVRAVGLRREHLVALARHSFESSFLSPCETGALVAQLERYVAEYPPPAAV